MKIRTLGEGFTVSAMGFGAMGLSEFYGEAKDSESLGFLTGKYLSNSDFSEGDFRKNNPRFSDENLQFNAKILQVLEPLADKYHCTLGQLALAWLLAQYEHIVPIPGTKSSHYARENAAAAEISLTAEDLAFLNGLKNHIEIKGERYTLEGMKGVNA